MNTKIYPFTIALACCLSACGGSNGGANFTLGGSPPEDDTGTVSIGISDAPVDDVKEVVIEIEAITFKKLGEDDVVVDVFNSTELGLVDAESFQIDLLDYQGSQQAIVIDGLELVEGDYSDIILSINDDDINNSYVVELDDSQKEIKVPPDTLKLGAFTVEADVEQTFTIEFNLRQSMTYRSGPEIYNLKPRGVRLQNNRGDRTISGEVDPSLFDTVSPCDEKTEPTTGNIVYLYQGVGLDVELLADVFDPEDSDTDIPANAIAPFSVESVNEAAAGGWEYRFAFLPAGEYTLVFSCDALDDDPENYDGLTLPLPTEQLIELNTSNSGAVCNLPIIDEECS